MSSIIRVLDEHTINKIAAGEVIENSASVVKELVENALDAGASSIRVELLAGGRQLIRVTDDGRGMTKDDAVLSLERHATSKIKTVEDIDALFTMGFRGEAIPSIASISKFSIHTRHESSEAGALVQVEGGRLLSVASAPRAKGTTIEVKDLFFNVPVRRKFQRSPALDAQEVLKRLTSLALSYPEVAFTLIHNESVLLQAGQEPFESRIASALGDSFFRTLSYKEATLGEAKLIGYFGDPLSAKTTRQGQYLFINKRAVVSPLISHFVREAYATQLPPGKHPLFVMQLTIPGSWVDPNVHPQKREVRLRREGQLKELIFSAVASFRKELPKEPVLESHFVAKPSSWKVALPHTFTAPLPSFEEAGPTPWLQPVSIHPVEAMHSQQEEQLLPLSEPERKTSKRVVATLPGFLLVEEGPDIFVVDQQAAHFAVLHAEFTSQVRSKNAVQPFLIPETIELSSEQAQQLTPFLDELEKQGIVLRPLGKCSFALDALPAFLKSADAFSFIEELVADLSEEKETGGKWKRKAALALARKATGRTRKLTVREAEELLARFSLLPDQQFCPLGQQVSFALTPTMLLKLYERKTP